MAAANLTRSWSLRLPSVAYAVVKSTWNGLTAVATSSAIESTSTRCSHTPETSALGRIEGTNKTFYMLAFDALKWTHSLQLITNMCAYGFLAYPGTLLVGTITLRGTLVTGGTALGALITLTMTTGTLTM
jgi:hypothetical protein